MHTIWKCAHNPKLRTAKSSLVSREPEVNTGSAGPAPDQWLSISKALNKDTYVRRIVEVVSGGHADGYVQLSCKRFTHLSGFASSAIAAQRVSLVVSAQPV